MNALTHGNSSSTKETRQPPNVDGFRVGTGANFLSGLFCNFPEFWKRVAGWETRLLQDQLESIQVDRPVYVAGLARSGTTLLLEVLAGHKNVATHQYRDFPALFTPYWWGQSSLGNQGRPTERTHGDRMMVTPQSPEAMEEMLWMSCFDNLHNPFVSQVLDDDTRNDAFEKLYKEHIRKLLLIRKGNRYVAKANYNLTRFKYLQRLFPDARFIVPVRKPEAHIASLMKQQRLFSHGENTYPRSLAHMQRVGHFEFGLDLRPVNTGNTNVISEIIELLENGESVRGWARYWASVYGWLHQSLQHDPKLDDSVLVIRYEDLCNESGKTLHTILEFAELDDPELHSKWEDQIAPPAYYRPDFSDRDRAIIAEETDGVAELFGYRL